MPQTPRTHHIVDDSCPDSPPTGNDPADADLQRLYASQTCTPAAIYPPPRPLSYSSHQFSNRHRRCASTSSCAYSTHQVRAHSLKVPSPFHTVHCDLWGSATIPTEQGWAPLLGHTLRLRTSLIKAKSKAVLSINGQISLGGDQATPTLTGIISDGKGIAEPPLTTPSPRSSWPAWVNASHAPYPHLHSQGQVQRHTVPLRLTASSQRGEGELDSRLTGSNPTPTLLRPQSPQGQPG